MNVYLAKIKSRKALERDRYLRAGVWGWWADVCPGKSLTVRDATEMDLARCHLSEDWSKNPDDYFCELPNDGSLVSKIAVEKYSVVTGG